MGKKQKKPGKGKEKTERKTAKADEKRHRRDSKKLSPEDDIDAILLNIQKEEAKKKEVHVEENVPRPSPRSNCSLTINPLKETELILYGGEFYNGQKTFVYGDLFRYDVDKQQWNLISSPNSPPPRSAHQAVAWKNFVYIYGGEFTSPNQERFHHYKDFWALDLKTNQWEQLNYKGCPSPRSGHRMILYKHKIIVFGGFYDTLREVRYYNDLHVFDLDQYKWQEIKPSPGCMWPSPRSGFQLFVYQDEWNPPRRVRIVVPAPWEVQINDYSVDLKKGCLTLGDAVISKKLFQRYLLLLSSEIFLYGGYYKEVSNEKSSSEKGVVHSDMWSLDPKIWEWNKVKKSGMPPGPRAGFSMCVHKKRAILFGGVVDMEMEGDVMMSLFLNELYGFQLDNHRWYPLELRKEKSTKAKLKKNIDESSDVACDTKLNTNDLVAADDDDDDDDEASDYEEDTERSIKNIAIKVKQNLTVDSSKEISKADETNRGTGSTFSVQNSISPEIVKPCGRINSSIVVGRDMLYIYGGMLEVKDREITLDDLYALNLSKLDEWKCLIPASEPEWIEASEDEEDDEDEDEDEDDSENGEGDSGEESGDSDEDGDDIQGANCGAMEMGDAVAIIKGQGKKLRRKEKRVRIEQIRASLGLSDSQRTPMPEESLKDFYKRTNTYWQMAAYEHTQHTGKELRKDGFDLAKGRYKELKPILDELAVLEAEQKAEEAEGPETSSATKRGNKKNKHLASK